MSKVSAMHLTLLCGNISKHFSKMHWVMQKRTGHCILVSCCYTTAMQQSFRIVSPTISRIWHVGDNDLGSTGNPEKTTIYKPDMLPPWKRAREQRYLNRHKANVLSGVRDIHGRLCHPCEMELRTYKFSGGSYNCRCLCPTSNIQKYINWQMAAFSSNVHQGMRCTLVSHLMTMVLFVFVGIFLLGYLMSSR